MLIYVYTEALAVKDVDLSYYQLVYRLGCKGIFGEGNICWKTPSPSQLLVDCCIEVVNHMSICLMSHLVLAQAAWLNLLSNAMKSIMHAR